MSIEFLTFDTIAKLDDGKIAKLVNRLIDQCSQDCAQRASERRAREIAMKIKFTPVPDELTGGCDEVNLEFEVGIKTPSRVSKTFNLGRKANGKLYTNIDSPDSARQMTLGEKEGRKFPPEPAGDETDAEITPETG